MRSRRRFSMIPLRFFLACICEGLGVDSGRAIWLSSPSRPTSMGPSDSLSEPLGSRGRMGLLRD